jgi:hypothetical protein
VEPRLLSHQLDGEMHVVGIEAFDVDGEHGGLLKGGD